MEEDSNTYYVKAPGTVNHSGTIYPPGAQLPKLKLNQSRALLLNNALTTIKPNYPVSPLSLPGEVESHQQDIDELVAKLDGHTLAQPAAAAPEQQPVVQPVEEPQEPVNPPGEA